MAKMATGIELSENQKSAPSMAELVEHDKLNLKNLSTFHKFKESKLREKSRRKASMEMTIDQARSLRLQENEKDQSRTSMLDIGKSNEFQTI